MTVLGKSAYLDRVNLHGTPALSIRGTGYNLVKRDEETGAFTPVDSLTRGVTSEQLEADYGVWQDKTVSKGALWWRETVREQDGKVQPDEVMDFAAFRDSQRSHQSSRTVGGDRFYRFEAADISVERIGDSDQGVAELNTEWSVSHGDSRSLGWLSPLAPPFA